MRRPRMYHSLLPGRRHLFIDCGGHDGCSIRRFLSDFDRRGRFEMVTFEPNGAYQGNYCAFPRHTLIQAAAHDRDGSQTFYLDRDDGDGSTLFKNKLTAATGGYGTLDTDDPVTVTTVDLSAWILANTSPADYVILKLDIEGAEYDVLEKMLRDRSVQRVTHLFVEWHWDRVGVPRERHERTVRALKRLRVPVLDWDAQGF